jgi:hypothetical protein
VGSFNSKTIVCPVCFSSHQRHSGLTRHKKTLTPFGWAFEPAFALTKGKSQPKGQKAINAFFPKAAFVLVQN